MEDLLLVFDCESKDPCIVFEFQNKTSPLFKYGALISRPHENEVEIIS